MTKIKFRCFYRGVMYPVLELHGEDSMSVSAISMDVEGLIRMVSPDSEHVTAIMQYTGLKDKNGKEIYEGDIIEVENDGNDPVCSVEWSVGQWVLMHPSGGQWTRQLYHKPHRLEIIGNIYENMELLT